MDYIFQNKKTHYIINQNFSKFKDLKPTIVFLHGWGGNVDSFINAYNYFSHFYPTLVLDFYGFGDSSKADSWFSLDDYVLQVDKLLNFLNLKKIIIIGHSFGGRVAIKLSSKKREYSIERLILVDSAGIKPRFSLKRFLKEKNYKIKKYLVKKNILNANCLTNSGSIDYKIMEENKKGVFVRIIKENLEKSAKNIVIPTLIIWGNNDKETPIYMAKKLRKLIKNSKLHFMNGGHYAYIENHNDFINIISNFIGE